MINHYHIHTWKQLISDDASELKKVNHVVFLNSSQTVKGHNLIK